MLSQLIPLALAPLLVSSTPVSLTPRQTNETESCFALTTGMSEWEVSDFDFHASYTFTTPAHQNSWGYVDFVLTNPVLGTTTKCSAASSRLDAFFTGDVEYECEQAEGDGEGEGDVEGADLSETIFTFDRPSGELTLEQSWYCWDNPQFPSRITAKGAETAQLECEETYWENGNWTEGQIYSQRNIQCDLTSFIAPVDDISAIA